MQSQAMRHKLVLSVLSVLIFCAGTAGFSQESIFQESWRWVHYSTESGLPADRVAQLIETPDSTVWVWTAGGVAWFRGFDWTPVSTGLPALSVGFIAPADGGNIFLILDDRTLYYGGREGFRRVAPEFAVTSAVVTIVPQAKGYLLLDESHGLWLLSKDLSSCVRSGIPVPPMIDNIWTTADGSLWGLTKDGVWLLDEKSCMKVIDPKGPFIHGTRTRSSLRGDGLMRISHFRGLRSLWEYRTAGGIHLGNQVSTDEVVSFDVARNGDAIVILDYGDVLLREDGKWSSMTHVPTPLSNTDFVQYRSDGDLWVGGQSGLFLFHGGRTMWSYWRTLRPSKDNMIADIAIAPDSSIVVVAESGVSIHRRDGSVQRLPKPHNYPLWGATTAAVDKKGGIWVGSGFQFSGAYRWDGKSWKHYGDAEGLRVPRLHRIRADRTGALWFLGIGIAYPPDRQPGAYRYDGVRFKPWGVEQGLLNGRVYAFAEDSTGSYWFATNGGLSKWTDGTLTHWTRRNGLLIDRIFCLTVDRDNRLWFGDQYNGLGTIENGQPRYLTTDDGLINNCVWDLAIDRKNRLWVSTLGGLAMYRSNVWSKFDGGTGLSCLRLWPLLVTDAKAFVGTASTGVAVLDLSGNHETPRINVTPSLTETRTATVRWTVFSYWSELPAEAVETRCRIDGGPWTDWSQSRYRVFTDLAYGVHDFEVQGKGLFGEYTSGGTVATINVIAPWYASTWFLLTVSVLAGIIILQIVWSGRIRRNQHRTMEASERRYRQLFEESPISLWEEDFSGVEEFFRRLWLGGVRDIRAYAKEHPSEMALATDKLKVRDVNRAALATFEADSKKALLEAGVVKAASLNREAFQELLLDVASGLHHVRKEFRLSTLKGRTIVGAVQLNLLPGLGEEPTRLIVSMVDMTEHRLLEQKQEELTGHLEEALSSVKTLRGLIPICSNCKKIRDDKGYWNYLEQHLAEHSDAVVSHGLCPDCAKKLYPEVFDKPWQGGR